MKTLLKCALFLGLISGTSQFARADVCTYLDPATTGILIGSNTVMCYPYSIPAMYAYIALTSGYATYMGSVDVYASDEDLWYSCDQYDLSGGYVANSAVCYPYF